MSKKDSTTIHQQRLNFLYQAAHVYKLTGNDALASFFAFNMQKISQKTQVRMYEHTSSRFTNTF